jgi:hypothetical protein
MPVVINDISVQPEAPPPRGEATPQAAEAPSARPCDALAAAAAREARLLRLAVD